MLVLGLGLGLGLALRTINAGLGFGLGLRTYGLGLGLRTYGLGLMTCGLINIPDSSIGWDDGVVLYRPIKGRILTSD